MSTNEAIAAAIAAAMDPSLFRTPPRSLARFHELCDAAEIVEGQERARVFISLPDAVQSPLWADVEALYAETRTDP